MQISQQCPLHDMIKLSAENSQHHITINNKTLAQIYQNISSLLNEIGNGDSVLVQLNQTSSNNSILALIVKNPNESSTDEQFRMFYVSLFEDQTAAGYRLYWKIFVDFFRNQMQTMLNVFRMPMNFISKLWFGQSIQPQNGDYHTFASSMSTLTRIPILLKTIDLPHEIEKKIIEFDNTPQKKLATTGADVKDNVDITIQQVTEPLFMRIISAFIGPFNPNRQAMNKQIGLIIADKGIRINIIGEQKISGVVDLFLTE